MNQPIVFDTETHAAGEERAASMTPDRFVRIAGWSGFGSADPVSLTADIPAFRELVRSSPLVAGSNVMAFDLPRLGLSRTEILDKARARGILDTWTIAPLMDQPESFTDARTGAQTFIAGKDGKPNMGKLKRLYRLDNLAHRYGHEGKLADLSKLATEHGLDNGRPRDGACCRFGGIPLTDPEYQEYLTGDVQASRSVLASLLAGATVRPEFMEYVWREHRVAAIAAVIGENGFRCDHVLAQQRADEGHKRSEEYLARLGERYGLTMTRKDGKPSAKPLATEGGRSMLSQALTDMGLSPWDLPDRTATGKPSFGGKSFAALAEDHPGNAELQELAEAVGIISGERDVYGTALKHLWPDGFSHPSIFMLQRSGRWSTTEPGLTVFGKRNGRVTERAIYWPDVLPSEVERTDDAHVLVSFDAAQIDARMVAVHSQDHAYMDLFGPGRDSHTEVALAIWRDAAMREDAKPMHHGFNYGLGIQKMARTAKVTEELAREFQDGMRRRFPQLIEWQRWVRDQGETYGAVDNGWGRIMQVDYARSYTQAPALVGQGAARDAMMHGLLQLPDEIICMIKAQIHDEIVLSVPIRDAREICQIVKRAMSYEWAPPWCSRPIQVEVDHGRFAFTWDQCYAKG